MRINRSKVIQHLERVSCKGQFKEVVFHGGFAVSAMTKGVLQIDTPEIEGTEPLIEEIGIGNLPLLIQALRVHPGEGNTGVEVDVYVEDRRLVIDDTRRGGSRQRLVLAAPRTIESRVEQETSDKLFRMFQDGAEIKLTKNVLEGVVNIFNLYKAEEIEVRISKGQCNIFVGSETSDRAEFELAADGAVEEFSVFFGKALVDVFATVQDFSSVVLVVNGANKPVIVADGEYNYLLSPRSQGSEVRAVKTKKSEDAAEAPASGDDELTAREKAHRRVGKKSPAAKKSAAAEEAPTPAGRRKR